MTVKSSFGAVNLDVNSGADHPSATELQPEAPFRILLLGDFSGRADKAAMSSTGWEPAAIDRDNFDEVLARLEPGVPGMRFRDLNDFHPDRIYQKSTLFQSLREVRRKLEEPSTFEGAAAEIRAWTGEQIPPYRSDADPASNGTATPGSAGRGAGRQSPRCYRGSRRAQSGCPHDPP